MAQNYYNMLGISKNASDKDIKAAYRKLARKLHPDVNPEDPRAQEQFKRVNEAYEVIGDPVRRKDYDQFGDNWKHADQMRNMGGGFRSPGGGLNLGDLFGGARGSGFENLFGGRNGNIPNRARHEGTVEVSLDEVYTGVTRRISIGTTMAGQRNLEVQIPKGVLDGRRIRLRPDASTEITITVKVCLDKRFTRQDANLRVDVTVPLLDVILGGEVEVPTMDGRIVLRVPPATQNGRSFKIKGKGLPIMNSEEFGDLYATIKVRLPDSLSEDEEDLYNKLRDIRGGLPETRSGTGINDAELRHT